MEILTTVQQALVENWHVWFLSTAMIIGAVIDGVHHKVPNWLTFPLIISGWVYSSVSYAVAGDSWLVGLGVSLLGTLVGLALLLPFYSIGGMVLEMSSCSWDVVHGCTRLRRSTDSAWASSSGQGWRSPWC